MQKVNIMHATLPEGMDSSSSSSSSDVFVDTFEYLPEGMENSSAQPSTSAAVSSEREPSSSPTDGPVKINPTGSFDSLYEVGKKLASGSHGIVHEGIRKSDGKPVIIKFVKKRRFDFHIGQSEPLCREAAVMRIMKHCDHVLKLYDWFDMEDRNILTMEHPGTSITLCDFIKENGGRLTEAEAKDIMQKLIAALQHCREQGVYYKDISLRKVLINKDTMQIKLTGFYRALAISERQTAEFKSVAERRIHALMATNEGLHRVLKRMVEGTCLLDLKLWFGWKNTRLSKEYQDLLWKLRDRESAITLEDILDHEWFNNTPGTPALESDEKHTEGREGRPRSAAVKLGIRTLFSKVCPCVADREPSQERPHTAADALELEPVFDSAQPSTSAAVSSGGKPRISPTDSLSTHYKIGRKLKSGLNVSIYEGIRKWDGQKVVIKFLKWTRSLETSGLHTCPLRLQLGLMRTVQTIPPCKHVVMLHDWFYNNMSVSIVMECLTDSVSLQDYIKHRKGPMTEEVAKQILLRLADSLQHCHDCDVSYYLKNLRDIFINPDTLQLKLLDFGESRHIVETYSKAVYKVSVAREMAMDTSLQCFRFVMDAFIEQIPFWKRLSRECQQLQRQLHLSRTSMQRLIYNLEDILYHPWFAGIRRE